MLELLVLLNGVGLLLAFRRSVGVANPFQIYFAVWLVLFIGLALTRHTFVQVSTELLVAALSATLLAIVLLLASSLQRDRRPYSIPNLASVDFRRWPFFLCQAAVTFALVPVIARAQEMSVGVDSVFTGLGYMRLRYSMTQEGQGFGVLSYLFMPAFVLSSIAVVLYRTRKIGAVVLTLSVITSLVYAYVSTGRTFVLLLFCLLFAPLVIARVFRGAAIAIASLSLIGAFMLVGALANKGIDIEAGLGDGLLYFLDSLRSYTLAPFLALSEAIKAGISLQFGENTLRFFLSVMYAIGITDMQPVELVKGYSYVPDMTNVYTVYEPYVRDFFVLGFLIPPLFLICHEALFRSASKWGGVWIFFYSASIYPLLMQFFQDQYMSLMSQWIQVCFWYVAIVKTTNAVENERSATSS